MKFLIAILLLCLIAMVKISFGQATYDPTNVPCVKPIRLPAGVKYMNTYKDPVLKKDFQEVKQLDFTALFSFRIK